MSVIVEYNPNNSGGSWWLKDKDWDALAAAGWKVAWAGMEFVYTPEGQHERDADGFPVLVGPGEGNSGYQPLLRGKVQREGDRPRYMGALARYAYKRFPTIQDCIREFESLTGQDTTDEGCNCCGAPHSFSWTDTETGKRDYASGEEIIPLMYENAPKSLREAAERLKEAK
jgi:hypothetical protein